MAKCFHEKFILQMQELLGEEESQQLFDALKNYGE